MAAKRVHPKIRLTGESTLLSPWQALERLRVRATGLGDPVLASACQDEQRRNDEGDTDLAIIAYLDGRVHDRAIERAQRSNGKHPDVGVAVTVTMYGAAMDDSERAGELATQAAGVPVVLADATTVETPEHIGTRFLFRAR